MRLGPKALSQRNILPVIDGIGYALHLGSKFKSGKAVVKKDIFYMKPGDFCLAETKEIVNIPTDLVGILEGKSSLARKGLTIHITSSRIDPGFNGKIVLELFNAGDSTIQLQAGMPIGVLGLEELTDPYEYKGTYCSNNGVKK